MEVTQLEAAIKASFYLDGDTLRRIKNGKAVKGHTRKDGYEQVSVRLGPYNHKTVYGHRIRYFLEHGVLPPEVDHGDGSPGHNAGANLREASHAQNLYNRRPYPRQEGLPRNVRRIRRQGQPRYCAELTHMGAKRYLGSFDTPEEASRTVEDFLRVAHGEFYKEQSYG